MYDVWAESRKHAAQVREFFEAYVSVGFTEAQAMELVKILFAGMVMSPPPRG